MLAFIVIAHRHSLTIKRANFENRPALDPVAHGAETHLGSVDGNLLGCWCLSGRVLNAINDTKLVV